MGPLKKRFTGKAIGGQKSRGETVNDAEPGVAQKALSRHTSVVRYIGIFQYFGQSVQYIKLFSRFGQGFGWRFLFIGTDFTF